jgi:mercuric ion transport protein
MSQPPSSGSPLEGAGSVSLTLAGIAAAFGVASCCGLPIVLASLGIGSASLVGVAMAAAPYREALLVIAAVCLLGGAILLCRQQLAATNCTPARSGASPSLRLLVLLGLVVGAALLWLGYRYV